MRNKHIVFGALLTLLVAFTTMSLKKMANPLLGKWQMVKKTEQKIQDGHVLESSEKNYKAGKKVFEFQAENKLIISDDYGKKKEKKKYVVEGPNVYIGKEKNAGNMYTIILKGNTAVLSRTKTKTKEGKTTVETDELTMERI